MSPSSCRHLANAAVFLGFVALIAGDFSGGAAASGLYTLETCPVTGKPLGSMGDPVIATYEEREVRFCCAGCVTPFEEDIETHFAAIDTAMIADQLPHYPLDTCVVAAMELGSMGEPIHYMDGNRLVRFCCAGCIEGYENERPMYWEKLNEAAAGRQAPEYPLGDVCVVSGEGLQDHGGPFDHVFSQRLVRLCCEGCLADFRRDPAGYLGALAGGHAVGGDHDHGHGHDHGHDHGHGDHHHGGHGGSGHDHHGAHRGGCGGAAHAPHGSAPHSAFPPNHPQTGHGGHVSQSPNHGAAAHDGHGAGCGGGSHGGSGVHGGSRVHGGHGGHTGRGGSHGGRRGGC